MKNNTPTLFENKNQPMNPFKDLFDMQRRMDRIFDRMWNSEGIEALPVLPGYATFTPACNIEETEACFLLNIDVPGVKKEDLKIEVRGNTLIVSGERKSEFEKKTKNYFRSESSYGSFTRSFDLPSGLKAEQIEAQYENGVLRVAIPKTETSKAQAVKIGESKGLLEKIGKSQH